MILAVLRSSGQLFHGMFFKWDFSDVFLMTRMELTGSEEEGSFASHHVTEICAIIITSFDLPL